MPRYGLVFFVFLGFVLFDAVRTGLCILKVVRPLSARRVVLVRSDSGTVVIVGYVGLVLVSTGLYGGLYSWQTLPCYRENTTDVVFPRRILHRVLAKPQAQR